MTKEIRLELPDGGELVVQYVASVGEKSAAEAMIGLISRRYGIPTVTDVLLEMARGADNV